MATNWIAGAIKKPGSLHKALGVPQGKKIPQSAVARAADSRNTNLARKAQLAETLEGLNK